MSSRTSFPITIAVITHNRAGEVCRTVEHLQALPEKPDIVVVDNASADGTCDRLAERFPGLRVIPLEHNAGAASRNTGIAAASTPFLAFCDDDTWWEAGALSRAVELFHQYPRLALISAHVLVGPENRDDPSCATMRNTPLRATDLPGYPVLGFMAGATIARRDALLAAGGFESRFFLGGEERLLAVDLAARGWGLAYVPEIVAHHHPSPRRDAPARERLLIRNALWFAWLRLPWRRAVGETVRLARRGLRAPGGPAALAEAIRGMPWVLGSRAVLPHQVERDLRKV